ncbi:MAG: hypothetical protein EVA89_31050 [Sandaracinaceae bacterium]|nr:MAG: hypothetical protein EVA89_31050 [Sandaracinaceae bacterium]
MRNWLHAALSISALMFGCDGDPAPDAAVDAGPDAGPPVASSSAVRFSLDGDVDTQETFFSFPFPSDLRLSADGTPDLTGYPNPRVAIVDNLLPLAQDRPGWPVIPVGLFRFGAPLSPQTPGEHFAAAPESAVLLVDVDPESPDRGRLYPTIAETLPSDRYTGDNLLGVAAYPGVVLHPGRSYAFVIRRGLNDAEGAPLDVPEALTQLAAGETPSGAWGEAAAALYAPLFETLDTLDVPRDAVAAATVFTTGDVVADLRDLSERVLDAHAVTVDDLALDPGDGATHERYCELVGSVSQPQFQQGTPPFDTEGLFEIGADGLPVEQRREDTPIVITIPKGPMPEGGYPLMVYFHGSGGVAAQVVDRGPAPPGGPEARGLGPAHMIAAHGIASVGAALPLSPDRLPGAGAIEYLNFDNLAAFRDTFRQGVLEQRLLVRALASLEIDPAALEGCDGPALPPGETHYRFDTDAFVATGQSMGGMYTNMIGAVEPRFQALVPTGAGGFWSFFILETTLIEAAREGVGALLRTSGDNLSHLHPAMHLLEIAWEAAEPMVYMPRLSRRPLPGLPTRPVYEPVGQGDSFFPVQLYDAIVVAYGHPQAGEVVWSSMQDALSVVGLDGVIDYPVANNLEADDGTPYTGVVVQSAGDGFSDPHSIYVQVPEIRHQWTCFLATAVQTGTAVVPPPAAEGTPCALP